MTTDRQFCRRTRREFLWDSGAKFPGMALAGMLAADGVLGAAESTKPGSSLLNPMAVKKPMFPAKAKSVIFVFCYGGPSHIDTFDYKPYLVGKDNIELLARIGFHDICAQETNFPGLVARSRVVEELLPEIHCADSMAALGQ